MQAIVHVMRVMDARARARVLSRKGYAGMNFELCTVFESACANEGIYITCNGKYTENCWAETETSSKELAGLH